MRRRKKNRNLTRKLLVLLMALAMVFGLAQTASADLYEPDRKGSFTLTLKEVVSEEETNLLSGVELKLYKVGRVVENGYVTFETEAALQSTGVDVGNLTTADDAVKAAQTLADAVGSSPLASMQAVTDEKGTAVFGNLDLGMYLITQGSTDTNVEVAPMLLSLPYMEDADTWLYDVNAFPKAVVHENPARIDVTKQVYRIDDELNIVPLIAEDATYHVGLFLDSEGTIPVNDDYLKDIHIQGASSGTVSYTDVLEGNYYLFEMDDDGNKIPIGEMVTIDDENRMTCVITNSENEDTNKAEILPPDQVEAKLFVNNYYSTLPKSYYLEGSITISKNVVVSGSKTTVGDTFYAGVFHKDSNGDLELVKVVELKQNGSVEVKVPLDVEDETVVDTEFEILETDINGDPVDKDTFGYVVSGEGSVILSETDLSKSLTITNEKILPSAAPTITPTQTPTQTPSGTTGGSTPTDYSSSGSSSSPVRTGDDTPIGMYIGLLAAAACVVVCAVVVVRRRKKH